MDQQKRILATNRKARANYNIEETIEAGIVLTGGEVKSAKEGKVSLKESYAVIENLEAYLVGCHIAQYNKDTLTRHDPLRKRKLLLKKYEIKRLFGKISQRGYTLVPLEFYVNKRGLIKVLLGLARGRTKMDKRRIIMEREQKRMIERELKERY